MKVASEILWVDNNVYSEITVKVHSRFFFNVLLEADNNLWAIGIWNASRIIL